MYQVHMYRDLDMLLNLQVSNVDDKKKKTLLYSFCYESCTHMMQHYTSDILICTTSSATI